MLRQIISLAGVLVLTASFSAAQKKPVTLDDVAAPGGGVSGSLVWSPAGDSFVIAERDALSLYNREDRRKPRYPPAQ